MGAQQSDTHGVPQNTDAPDKELEPGGSADPVEDPKEPGATAAMKHPPAEQG
ncbi:MAG: hypothetical protein HKN24_01300 [Acidimicrobiales bacterium]|nr:hypothetical protein [Acidimicrobiales bacterium]